MEYGLGAFTCCHASRDKQLITLVSLKWHSSVTTRTPVRPTIYIVSKSPLIDTEVFISISGVIEQPHNVSPSLLRTDVITIVFRYVITGYTVAVDEMHVMTGVVICTRGTECGVRIISGANLCLLSQQTVRVNTIACIVEKLNRKNHCSQLCHQKIPWYVRTNQVLVVLQPHCCSGI